MTDHTSAAGEDGSPLRIGVWMPLPPGTRLRGEGLMRLLAFISAGFPHSNARFVIVTPPWMHDEFEAELQDMPAEQRAIYELRMPRTWFSRVYVPFHRWQMRISSLEYKLERREARRPARLRPALAQLGRRLERRPALTLGLLGLLPIAAVGVFAVWPVATLKLLGLMFVAPAVYLGFYLMRMAAQGKGLVGRTVEGLRRLVADPWRAVRDMFGNLTRNAIALKDRLLDTDLRLQAEIASRDADIACWFTMHVTADSARFLKGPKVALFADFVFFDCPALGSRDWLRRAKSRAKRLVRHVDAVITLAEHVRSRQLYRYFPAARNAHVAIIDHAPIDLGPDLPEAARQARGDAAKTPESLAICGAAVRAHIRTQLRKEVQRRMLNVASYSEIYEHQFRYLDGFPIEETRFIFVSTQIRPYKNILNLIKAVEVLISRRGLNVKLLLSGNFQPDQDVYTYVRDNGLYYDVWSIPRLPRAAHASMYHCATLTVHPTFFEGGQGAFPLSESLSAGTPVLLSRHPGTLADADSALYHEMLFDPYDVEEIADRIALALANPEQLFARQQEIFRERIERRSWVDVSRQYIEVFNIARARHTVVGGRGHQRLPGSRPSFRKAV